MGVHCINPKSKDFLNISKRLNISPANLEDIIHKYLYERDTDEYPSDDYIKAALEGTRTTMSQELADLWERYYLKPKRFKTLLELNRAKLNALKFFRKEAISEYIDADGNYVLKVAKAKNTRQLFYSKSPNLRQLLIEEAKSKLRDYYRLLVIPTNTELEYIKALAIKRKMDKHVFYSPNNSDDLDSLRQREIASVIENIKREIPSYLLKNIRLIVLHNGGIRLLIDLNPESLIKESYIDSVINSWIDGMSNDSILNEAERIDLAETSEAYYINPKKKEEILSLIKKRAKLNTLEEINEAIDFLETLENTPELNLYVATCILWLKTDSILLPRDNEKLLTLFLSARKLKLDVLKYKNPIELMIAVNTTNSKEVEQGTKINPEAISQLTFNTIITNSKGEKLYVYDVEDSPSGLEAVCLMLADASPKKEGTVISNSPWCLSTFNYNKDTGKATPTESARNYWNKYNRGKRLIALLNNETPIAFNSSSSNKDEWWDFYDGQYNSFEGYSDLKSVDTSSAKKVYKRHINLDGLLVIRLGNYAYDIIRNTIMRKIYTNSTGFTVHKDAVGLDITLNNYHRQRYIFLKSYHANSYSYKTFRLRAGNYGISIDFFDNNRIRTIEINYRTKKGKYKINYNFPFKGSIIELAIQEAVAFMDNHKSDSITEFNSTNIAQAKEIANKLLNNDDVFNSIKEYSEELIRKEEEEKELELQEPIKQSSAEILEALLNNNQRLLEINTRLAVLDYLVDNEEQANQAQEYNIEDLEEETDTLETTLSTVSAVEEREYTIDEETKKTLEEVNKKTKKKFSIKDLLRLSKLLKERDVKDLYNEAIGQKVNSELETILKDILKEYHFEAWEGDLKEIFGNDILGATDFINKIIYLALSKNRNAITMPEEFAHSFIKLMGARYRKEAYTTPEGEVKKSRGLHPENKEYSELRDLVELTSLYKLVYDLYSKDKQYLFPNGTPNTIKIKEEAVGQALAAILTNRYKAKTEAEANWYERLKLWFNDVLNAIAARLLPNAERKLRRRMTKIADSILDGSYREKYLDKFDSSKFQLLNYNETILNMTQRDNGYTLLLLKDISSLGGVVTGSLSYRALGTVYRKGLDLIHDIDVIVPESKSKLSARHPSFKRYNSTPLLNRWTLDKLMEIAKETDYYQKLKDKYPDLDIMSAYVSLDNKLITNAIICSNQELKNKFINMEGDFNSRMNKLTQEERDLIRLVDLFFDLDDRITDLTFLDTENNINLANYGVSFEEKMKFARAKDIFDYQKFNPFSRMRPVDTSNMSLMFQKTPDLYEKELLDILAKAPRDSQGRLLAPNSKPSNLTERQYALVRTKEFKDWFGDWENDPANASKVVDENGEPLVVYHSSINYFTTFSHDFGKTKTGAKDSKDLFFFMKDKEGSSWYSIEDWLHSNGKNHSVYNVEELIRELSDSLFKGVSYIKKPLTITYENGYEEDAGAIYYYSNGVIDNATDVFVDGILGLTTSETASEDVKHKVELLNALQEYEQIKRNSYSIEAGTYIDLAIPKKIQDLLEKFFIRAFFLNIRNLEDASDVNKNNRKTSLINYIEHKEKDGFVIRNTIDSKTQKQLTDVYAVRNPNQIKSATDNTGAFSTTNDDIYDSQILQQPESTPKTLNIYAGTNENADLSNFAERPFTIPEDFSIESTGTIDIADIINADGSINFKVLEEITDEYFNNADEKLFNKGRKTLRQRQEKHYDGNGNLIENNTLEHLQNVTKSALASNIRPDLKPQLILAAALHDLAKPFHGGQIHGFQSLNLVNKLFKGNISPLVKFAIKHHMLTIEENKKFNIDDATRIMQEALDNNLNLDDAIEILLAINTADILSGQSEDSIDYYSKKSKRDTINEEIPFKKSLLVQAKNKLNDVSKVVDENSEPLSLLQTLEVFSTRLEMLNTMILEADGFIGEVSQSPYTKVGNKFVIKNNTEVEKAVNYISKRGVHKDRRSSLLSEKSIKYLTEDKDNTSYYNIGYSSGEPYITAVTNRELFDENYTPKTIMFLRDLGRLDEDIIKTQLEQFKDTSTFLVDASDTKAIEFFDKNGYNYKVYQVRQQLSLQQKEIQLSTTGYKKGDPLKNPDVNYVFTENAEAYVVSNKVALDKIPDFPNQGKTKLNVSDVNGTNQAGIRTDSKGNISPNAYGIVVKKYLQDANGRFVAKEGQFQDTDEDFALFVKLNEDMFKRLSESSNKLIVFPTQMGLGKAALPKRFAEWLQAKLLEKFGILSTIEKNARADYDGYGLRLNSIELKQLQQTLSLTLQQLLSTLPMVTKIISGGLTGVDTIGLQVARELGIETGGTAPKGFLRERGIDDEDISSYNLTEITDEELADYTKRKGKNDPYTGRTELNVRNSDGTVYFYTADDELGMLATKRSAKDWGKPFITNPTAELLKQWLIDNNIKTLNVAGNRGSKLDKNNNVAKILREALINKPKLKQEEKRDPYRERQQEITRLLNALQESSLMTNIEIREIAEQVVYWISDHITELLQNPELAVKIYGDTVKNLNTQEASRIEIVNAIGLDNIKEMCKLKFSPKNAGYTKISTIRKANLIIDNWDAIMLLASDVFTDIEKFSITETVVADKVVSLTNENLNNNLDNFNAEEQNDEESMLETHGNLLEHWQTKANTIDIMDSMSLLMHRVIAQCYQLEEVSRDENNKPVYDKVKSEFGINLRVKPREVTGSLLRWCQGCLNIKDVIANLKAKESANPWISLIITKLEDNSGNESDFLSLFFGVFVKPFMSYSIVKIDENGNYISQVVNKNPALKETIKGITTLYKIGEHPMFKSDGAVNKETFKLFSEAMKELANLDLEKDKDKIAHNLGFMYNALGFSITSDLVSQILDEDTYKTLTTQFGYIHKSLYDNLNIANPKDYEPLKFRGKGSFLGTLNKVLKPITDTLEDTAVSAFYDNGNMYQSYVIPSYMTKLMSKFHLNGEKFDLFVTNEYGKYDWFKEHNSRDIERGWKLPILRELVTNPKAREVFDHKVLLTFNKHQYMKKMDDTEVTLAILAEYWAETTRSDKKSGRIPAWFRVPMLSNKPSAEYIKFYSERGINYQDVITDNVYKIFLQEMSRILTVMTRNYGEQDPEFIKNFDKNGKKFNFVDFMNEYLTGDSKNSLLGKLIESKLNGLKLSSLEELTFSNLAKKAINDALTKKAESIVNNFERKGIFEGAKKIEGIDKDNIREELINFAWNDTYMSMNILQLTITDIAYYKDAEDLQKRLALIHAPGIRANLYATDYQGNPVSDGKLRTIYLKDFNSFISNIVDNVSVVFDRKIKNAKTEEEKLGYTVLKESIVELFKSINVADAQGYSSPTSYRKKALLFGKWSKGAEDIYRKLISGEYTYSDLKTAFLPLKPFVYTLIEKSSNVNSDEAPMSNLKVGVLNKNSEYLLIMADALLLGEDTGKPNLLRALYSVMEESSIDVKETTLNNGKKQRVRTPRIDGLDTVLFESTVKAGLRGAIDINQFAYDEDGERKAKEYIESLIGKNGAYNETYVDEIPVEDYCLLQEIPAHFRGHELAHGSLIRAITPSDLESTDALGNPITYNVEGKELTAELFKTEYEKTIAANIKDSIETLTKELNLGPEATWVDKNRALEKILRREILSSPRYGVDLLLACTLNEEGLFRIPKGDPIQSKRIELLLNSIIKNRVNKQEIAGGPVVQVSNFGTSRELNIRFKAKGGGLLMTRKEFEKSPLAKKVTATSQTDKFNARYGKASKTMTYELYIKENQAGIAYFEVFAPIYLNDIFEKFQNPDGSIDIKAIEELNPDLLKMIGYRIPTEDKYSCAPLKIVGFLPKEAGDTIMLPNDITLLTGSDFDIDKEYLMRKDIPITLRDKKDIFDDMFLHFTANKNLSKETIKDIKNAINLFLNNPNPKLLDFSKSQDRVLWTYYKKFAYKAEAPTEGRTYRNNKIVDMTWEVLTHESNADKILNPGGFEPLKKMGYLISAYRNPANTKSWEELVAISKLPKGINKLKELCYTEKNLCYIDTHIQFYKQNSAAGSLIGTFAVHKTAHAILESDGFKIDIESICPPFMIDGMEFNNGLFVDPRYDRKGNLIGKTLGSLVASAADAVKDPILNLMNINSNTSNVLNTLIRLGMDFDTAALFLSLTAITNILEEHSKRNITEYTSLNKVIKERCEELEGDYSINETLLTQEPITMDELISGLNPDIDSIDPKTEYRILKAFSNLLNIGSAMRSLTRVTRFNSVSSAVGPLIIDNLIAEHLLENFSEKILYKGESCGIEKVYQLHPLLRQFARTLDIAKDLMSDMPANSNGFRYLLGASKSYKETFFGDRKLLSLLSDFYLSYALMASGVINSSELESYIKDFPALFIKNYLLKYKSNPLINAIKTDVTSTGTAVLKIDTTGLDQKAKDILSMAWIDLHKKDPELSTKLFIYNLFRGGVGFNPKTFTLLAPTYVKERIPNYIATYRKLPQVLNTLVLDQFIRNNWNNNKLVPTKKVGLKAMENNPNTFAVLGDEATEEMKEVLYFKTKDSNGNYTLWRLTYGGANAIIVTYEKILPLGNNGEYIEMSTTNIKESLDAKQTKELFDEMDNDIPESTIEPQEESIEYTDKLIEDILYRAMETGNNINTRELAILKVLDYKNFSEEKLKKYEKSMRIFLNKALNKLGITVEEDLVNKVYNKMCK